MKIKMTLIGTVMVLMAAHQGSRACTNLIITRGASSDGSVMIT